MEIKVRSKSQFKRLSIDSRRQTPMQKCQTLDVLRIPEQFKDKEPKVESKEAMEQLQKQVVLVMDEFKKGQKNDLCKLNSLIGDLVSKDSIYQEQCNFLYLSFMMLMRTPIYTQLRQAKKSSSPSTILDQLLENASLLSQPQSAQKLKTNLFNTMFDFRRFCNNSP